MSSGFPAEHVHSKLHDRMALHKYATRSHPSNYSTSLSTRNSIVQRARGLCSERDSRHLLHRSANTGEREGDGGCWAAGCVSGHHPGQGCSRPRGPHCRARRRHGSCHWLLCAPFLPLVPSNKYEVNATSIMKAVTDVWAPRCLSCLVDVIDMAPRIVLQVKPVRCM